MVHPNKLRRACNQMKMPCMDRRVDLSERVQAFTPGERGLMSAWLTKYESVNKSV